jgi:hypothetical protein
MAAGIGWGRIFCANSKINGIKELSGPRQRTMKKTKTPSRKTKTPDKIEGLVRKHLANIAIAEGTFKSALTLLEKYETKYPELEQYVKSISESDRSLQILDDVKDSRETYHTFKIVV